MIYYHNLQQSSDEWFDFKSGKLSASSATAIGANGAGLKTYAKVKAMEKLGIQKKSFTSADIERGNELEPVGIAAYELEYSVSVDLIGCVSNDKYTNVCISPDGLIGNDGGCEIKAKNDEKHFSLILGETKEIPFNQIQMSLLISERKWWDFISINPNFDKPIFVKRVIPDLVYFERLKIGFKKGNELIEEYCNKYKTK